jgi:O-methyltransferase
MIAGMADVLGEGREYFLFDSFQGLPPAKEIDGAAALAWQKDKTSVNYYDNCTASIADAESAMHLSKAKHVRIFAGWFNQTIPEFQPSMPIALLRLDADWYDSTMTCLTHLVKHMAEEGVIIIDDYYTWDGCSRAVHDFLARQQSPLRIRQMNNICFLKFGGG